MRKLQNPPIDDISKELDRGWLAPILNSDSPVVDVKASRRVFGLLQDLLALDHLRSELAGQRGTRTESLMLDGWLCYRFAEFQAEAMNKDGQRLLRSINGRLRRYRWHPNIFFSSFNIPGDYSFDFGAQTETAYQENLAVEVLLDYLSEGKIGWFRRCVDCNRWFIAATEHQRYCSTKCRVRNHSDSEDFKRKRARYMRLKYRPNLKAREEAAKQLARSAKAR